MCVRMLHVCVCVRMLHVCVCKDVACICVCMWCVCGVCVRVSGCEGEGVRVLHMSLIKSKTL